MKRERIRRLEPGKIGGGRGTKGRSSKRLGGGISAGEIAQQWLIFCNNEWRCRSQECKVRRLKVWNPFPPCLSILVLTLLQVFMEKHRNLSYQEQLLEDINRAEQDKFEVPEKLILDLIRSVLHLFVCTPLQAQPVLM